MIYIINKAKYINLCGMRDRFLEDARQLFSMHILGRIVDTDFRVTKCQIRRLFIVTKIK